MDTKNVIVNDLGERIFVEIGFGGNALDVFDSHTTTAALTLAKVIHPDRTFHVISFDDYCAGHFA